MNSRLFYLTGLLALITFSGCQTQQGGNSVAFSRLTGDYWQIWIMKADGSDTEQLTASPMDKRYPVWATDGDKLFFRTSNNQVFVIEPDSGKESQILASLGQCGGVIPSPDSKKLLAVRYRSRLKDSSNLWITDLKGENARMITRGTGLQYDPDCSSDGKHIAYVSGHGYRSDEVYIIDSHGKHKRRLTSNNAIEFLPAFSPDGDTIAYVSDITGNYEIWLMDMEGENKRQLTDSEGLDTRPCWSPNGKKIMFISNRGGNQQLWIMNKDGSAPRRLTSGAPSIDPAWRK